MSHSHRSSFLRGTVLFAVVLSSILTADKANAQVTVKSLIGSSVEKVDETYEDVAKAILVFRRGRGDAAMAFLAKAKKEHPELPPAEVMYAQLSFGYNRMDSGQAILQLAVVRNADDPEPWIMLADIYLRQRKLAEAEVLFKRGLELANKFSGNDKRKKDMQINANAGMAAVFERRNQWKESEAYLRKWIELDGKNTNAWVRLANVFFRMEKYDTAKETLVNLGTFAKDMLPAEVLMGNMYQQIGEDDKARQSMQEAVQKHGDDFETRMAVGRWALTTGNQDMLKASSIKAKELNSDSMAVDALLGMSERFAGNSAKAEEIFSKMVDKNPASFDGSNGLALAMLDQDDKEKYRKALGYAQVNVKSNPDRRTARGRGAAATFAWALHRLNQNAAASRVMDEVIKSGEISPEIGYFAAVIYNEQGNTSLAKTVLEQAMSSYVAFPQQKAADALLLELKAKELAETEAAAAEAEKAEAEKASKDGKDGKKDDSKDGAKKEEPKAETAK